MTKSLRIVFMGTPGFAVASLDILHQSNHHVVGVITAADKPAGRGRKLQTSAVKKYALENNIGVLQPTNLKDDSFNKELQELEADLFVVVAFRMLPEVVWKLPKFGTFNLHASLLPQYRGAAPINWALINGETETGITTFFIDEKIDTGAIIYQEKTMISSEDTAGSLHDKLMLQGGALILKTVNDIAAGIAQTTIQPTSKNLKTAYKLNQDNTKISWDASPSVITDLIRGLNPYPGSWCQYDNQKTIQRVKIYKVKPSEPKIALSPGHLFIKDKHILVGTQENALEIEELQMPGKRKMTAKELLNGYNFPENSKLF